jgi:hypothetical protein
LLFPPNVLVNIYLTLLNTKRPAFDGSFKKKLTLDDTLAKLNVLVNVYLTPNYTLPLHLNVKLFGWLGPLLLIQNPKE